MCAVGNKEHKVKCFTYSTSTHVMPTAEWIIFNLNIRVKSSREENERDLETMLRFYVEELFFSFLRALRVCFAVTELKRLRGDELGSLWVRSFLRDNSLPATLPYFTATTYNLFLSPHAVIFSNGTARSAHVFKIFISEVVITVTLYVQVHLVKVD